MSATITQYMAAPEGHRHVFSDGGLGILTFDESTGATVLERVEPPADGEGNKAYQEAVDAHTEIVLAAIGTRGDDDRAGARSELFKTCASADAALKDAREFIKTRFGTPTAVCSGCGRDIAYEGFMGIYWRTADDGDEICYGNEIWRCKSVHNPRRTSRGWISWTAAKASAGPADREIVASGA